MKNRFRIRVYKNQTPRNNNVSVFTLSHHAYL
jgi:hypothetical protein